MSHYGQGMRQLVREYRIEGRSWPASAAQLAEWAIAEGRWRLPPAAALRICAKDFARAMREETITDPEGRRIRSKHPATIRRHGAQVTLWDDVRTAPRHHMAVSFAQRRARIVYDCVQLKIDVDGFNTMRSDVEPIQLLLDFRRDVIEAEQNRAA